MAFTDAQRLAIEHEGSDLLISAGAGSGKTFTLTQRIVERIKSGKDISKMLIVTFTKEAANELRARISKALFQLYEAEPSDRLNEQIVKTSCADISTIDSFCYKIVKSNFDKVGLDGGIHIGGEVELNILAKEAMGEVVDEFYEKPEADEDFYLVVDCYSDNKDDDALKDNLLKLYNDLSNTTDFLEGLRVPALLDEDFFETKYGKVLKKHTIEMLEHYMKVYDYLVALVLSDAGSEKKYINAINSDISIIIRALNAVKNHTYEDACRVFESYKPESIGRNSAPQEICDIATSKRNEFKASFNKLREEYYSSDRDAIKLALEQNNRICRAMYRVLSCFDERYRKKKALFSICSFNDISRYALRLLYNEDGTASSLAKDLADKYDEIYIDEYQDTNSIQDSIFKAISRNNRFMVGDIKQSIYKFRLAEPEIFDHYKSTFADKELYPEAEGGKSLFMSSNFRCNREIIDFTNLVSDYMFTYSDGILYQPKDRLEFHKDKDTSPQRESATIYLVDTTANKEEPEACQMGQARLVAKTIKKLLDKGQLANGKPLKRSDFAILLRSTKYGVGEKYAQALKEYGIGSQVTTDISFYEKPHILLMLSILNAVDNPYNDIYLAGAMRSSVFGFGLDDMIKIRATTPSKDVPLFSAVSAYREKMNDELAQRVNSFIETLNAYRDGVKRLSANDAVYYLMTETGISQQLSKSERQDLIKLYNKAREFEGGSFKGLYRFLSYVKNNMEASDKETIASDIDNVQIMTIHASKGLEFEYCFVCDMETSCDKQTRSSIIYERTLGIAGHISKDDGIIKYNTLMRKCIDLQKHRSAKDEEMRVLYVAMTRARTRLFVTASLPKALEHYEDIKAQLQFASPYQIYSTKQDIDFILGGLDETRDFYDLKIIDPLTLKSIDEMDGDGSVVNQARVDEYERILRRRFDFKYEYEHLSKMPSKLSISKLTPLILDGNDNNEVRIDKSLEVAPKFLDKKSEEATAADKGTATHVFMQFCDFKALKERGYRYELDRLTASSFISEKTKNLINEDHINLFINSPLMDMMLKAKMIKREFRFNLMLDAEELTSDEDLKKEKVLVQGVVDCLFEDENGQLILVDYKTDKVTEDNYVYLLTKNHSTQLRYYKKACELMFKKPISKVIIYSVPLAKNVELKF